MSWLRPPLLSKTLILPLLITKLRTAKYPAKCVDLSNASRQEMHRSIHWCVLPNAFHVLLSVFTLSVDFYISEVWEVRSVA